MTISGVRPRLVALLITILACVGLLSLSSAPAWALAGTIKEFPIPTKSAPIAITAGPDGNLWFTENEGGMIGRITPAGSITEFALPTGGSFPSGITTGPDGNLWFTEENGNLIGRITPAGLFTSGFLTPTAKSRPEGITVGPDGNIWFTEENASKIGRITTS